MIAAALFLSLLMPTARVEGSGARHDDVRVLVDPSAAVAVPEAVVVRGALRVEIITGVPGAVVNVSAEENLLPLIVTELKDGAIVITTRGGDLVSAAGIVAKVSLPKVTKLTATATAHVTSSLSGACTVSVHGASRATLTGSASDVVIDLRGAAVVDATALRAERVTVTIAGAAELELGTSKTLSVNGRGVGRVRYRGDPTVSTNVGPSVKVSRART